MYSKSCSNKPFLPSQSKRYLDYYKQQCGGAGVAKFHGSSTQYGYGLGSLIKSIIRRIIPIGSKIAKAIKPVAKEAFRISKPHLKNAAKDLTKAALEKVAAKLLRPRTTENQTGSGRKRRRAVKTNKSGKKKKIVKSAKRQCKRPNHVSFGEIF